MPSLFSRARTASTPTKFAKSLAPGYDELGRITSRDSGRGVNVTTGKKDKDKKKGGEKDKFRLRTVSSNNKEHLEYDDPLAGIPDGSFLALDLEPPRCEPGEERPKEHDYGYLSYQRHVVLGLEQVARLVDVVSQELGTRGLTTPFIFSTLALDIRFNSIKSLIRSFLRTCANPSSADAERQWRDEARFAGPNELGMCLRWGLARLVRIHGGQEVRGLVAYEYYADWRDLEAALNYPPSHFSAFLSHLTPVLGSLITNLLSLLTRFTAHSAQSGHTPPTLSPLFGPLFFGLGPAALPFHHTYIHYLRAVNAMEHLMLAFIRWQEVYTTGSAASLGVPTRLKDWIRGYPAMLPAIQDGVRHKDEKPQPRRGARTVRVVSVRRNVRMYSPDLVKTGASWASRPRGFTGTGENGMAASKEWQRVAPPTLKLQARYSDGYKKRMVLAPNFHPQTGPSASSMSSVPSTSSTLSSSTGSTLFEDDESMMEAKKGEVRSLTSLKWGEFESMGFGGSVANAKKLEFDLTEGARAARAAKRTTLTWQDFSSSGFSRNDAPLSATLEFSVPVADTISSWPTHSAEIHKKLKKTQKALPPFGWDTEPVMGAEEVIEEAFVDIFCDLIFGGGWMDLERLEEIDRECNWALVEFKSLPISRTNMISEGADPRTAATLVLFEEFVPWEYRKQLGVVGTRRRLPSLFSPSSKSKQWKAAATLNGRPYVIGHVPQSPTVREVEFEGLLRGNHSLTKVMTLDGGVKSAPLSNGSRPLSVGPPNPAKNMTISKPLPNIQPVRSVTEPPPKGPVLDRVESPATPTRRAPRFRLPVGLPTGGPAAHKRAGMVPAESKPVDFETRMTSYSDEEQNENQEDAGAKSKHERRRSKDDAWVDILVASNSRRLGGQDAEIRLGGMRGSKGGRSDPELASQEVALALAAVRGQAFSDDEDDSTMEPVRNMGEPGYDASQFGEEDEEEEEEPVRSTKSTRRLTYFDLHPERRPVKQDEDDDPRSHLAHDSDEEIDEDEVYGGIKNYGVTDPKTHASPPSNYSHVSSDEPIPEAMDEDDVHEYEQGAGPHSRIETMLVPAIVSSDVNNSNSGEVGNSKTAASKTAALIEMYRERERASSASPSRAPPSPSPSPVRGAIAKLSKEQIPLPAVPSPSSSPTPPSIPVDTTLVPPQPIKPAAATGEVTPPRYVHGAPLHNVLEEEEEID